MTMLSRLKQRMPGKGGLRKPLLVLLSDGFSLLVTVVANKTSAPAIVAAARSRNPDPEAALLETVSMLGINYGRLPREAVLLHASAVPALLELGIENLENLETERVRKLVRWEVEANFAGTAPQDYLGWLMVGLGYLTEEQRDLLVDKQKQENAGPARKIRLGELAVREGCLDNQQLEHCLRLQDELQSQDRPVRSGWKQLDADAQARWLAAAINGTIHQQWVRAFGTLFGNAPLKKIRLLEIIPCIGAAAWHVPGINNHETVYLLELHRAYVALLGYSNGNMCQCRVLECNGRTPVVDDIASLIGRVQVPAGGKIYALAAHPGRGKLLEALPSLLPDHEILPLEREARPLLNPPGEVGTAEALLLLGAARNQTNPDNGISVSIQGEDPPLPWHQRPAARAVAVLIAIACLISVIEIGLAHRQNRLSTELAEIKEQVGRQEAVKDDMRASRANQVRLDLLKQELEQLTASKKLIESVLVTRRQFTRELLDIVTRNLNDHILINNIEETDWNKFIIEGWALDQPSVDQYGLGLSRDLQAWNMVISDNPSVLGRSAAGFNGYNFKFVIEKNKPQPAATVVN